MEQRAKQLKIANRIEDKNIKRIGKQLKLNRRKSKTVPKSFIDDGLDYLLEICDPENRSKFAKEEFDFADNEAGFEEDLALLNSQAGNISEEEEHPKVKKRKCKSKSAKNLWSVKNIATETGSKDPQTTLSSSEYEVDKDLVEDIYGRLRDRSGKVVNEQEGTQTGKYVPPGKRLAVSTDISTEMLKVKRQLKGLLNRLAEPNLPSIVSSIEKLYLTNSRHNMQEAINSLVTESLVSPVLSPERLIMEHCVLIAALHANVGVEVGAQFLELIVKRFDSSFETYGSQNDDKELDNLVLIMANMYNFGLISATLLKDIIFKFIERFQEKDIDLILILLKTVGFAWRKDDPISLKEIIISLQAKAAQATEQPPRIRFMLEILLAIRNNNMTKIPNYDASHTEHLRKLLRSLMTKGGAISKLNITYTELLTADKRGRWWVVGSAWAGQGPVASSSSVQVESTTSDEPEYSAALLEMARKQRMNTELRRNIFCILMSAEDFIGAFEKLMRLGLKDQQEREIIHVIMDCCLHEKIFNPYYAYLMQKFCRFNRRFQIASQFAFWDRFKELESMSQMQISHLSKLVIHLTIEGSLSLSVLRVIQFTEMDRVLVRFIRQILLGMFDCPIRIIVLLIFFYFYFSMTQAYFFIHRTVQCNRLLYESVPQSSVFLKRG